MATTCKLRLEPKYSDDAEPAGQEILTHVQTTRGFVPHMYNGMVNSPGMLDTYLHGYAHFREESGFSPQEQEVVLLTISHENRCSYCVAAHSTMADQAAGVPSEVTDAIRDGGPIPDDKLAALSQFTRIMVAHRGNPTAAELSAFLEAGYSDRQVLEIILAIAVKTISNYSNHLFHTEEDEKFACRAWVFSEH